MNQNVSSLTNTVINCAIITEKDIRMLMFLLNSNINSEWTNYDNNVIIAGAKCRDEWKEYEQWRWNAGTSLSLWLSQINSDTTRQNNITT